MAGYELAPTEIILKLSICTDFKVFFVTMLTDFR